jgi:hypothetical protein
MLNWSPSEFMSRSPRYVYLLIQSHGLEDESFNQLQENLRALNVRPVNKEIYLIFSHEDHGALTKRVFDGVAPTSKALLALVSDTVSAPV